MPLNLDELKSLIGALGVKVPENILEERAKEPEFKTRREKVAADASGKPADWRLKKDFDDVLKRAADSADKQQFSSALKSIEEAEQLLQKTEAPPVEAKGGDDGFSIVQLQKSRLAWDNLRKTVQAQLAELETSIVAGIRAHNEDEAAEDEFEEGEVKTAVKTLHTVLGGHDQRLLDKLDEALNATSDEQRRGRHQEAAGIIKEYQAFVASDPTLAMIDENGFTKSTIRDQVAGTLTELAGKF